MNLALICIGNMTTDNGIDWITTEAIFDDKDLQGAWLYYKGAVIGKLTQNVKKNTFAISIGMFDR